MSQTIIQVPRFQVPNLNSFCCKKESYPALMGLAIGLGFVSFVLMQFHEYHLDDILEAQRQSKEKGEEVRPRRRQSSFMWYMGIAIVVILLWFMYSLNRCAPETITDKVTAVATAVGDKVRSKVPKVRFQAPVKIN